MNLKTYCIELDGGQSAFAKNMGVSEAQIWQWSNGVRNPNPESCVRIEQETQGKVTRQELRPDDWQAIWPELIPAIQINVAGQGA